MFKYNDRVKLIKPDGQIIENIEAIAQPDMVFIKDEKIPVEENDIIERTLPSGVIERKMVVDPGYHGKHAGFSAYQCKVKSINQINKKTQNIVYNINGTNSKVNINSVDNSTNNITVTPQEIFLQLEKVISEQIENNQELIKRLTEMKENQGKPMFKDKYQGFIASAANYMTIIAPFIPALTQML